MTRINFETALQKGEIGETIIREFLEEKGWVVYFPFTKNKAHAFDMLATYNKETVFALDVKTKARFNNWEAQGINIKHYNEYMKFKAQMSIPFYIVFIDDKNGDVHSMELKEETPSFKVNENIVAWHLKHMKYLFNIGQEKIQLLSQFDQRNYEYRPQ